MLKALFYSDSASYVKAKTADSVIQAHDPFNMIVIDENSVIPGDSRKVKNSTLFSNIGDIPSDKAIITTTTSNFQAGQDYFLQAKEYFKSNNITILNEFVNINVMVVELPKSTTYADFANKIGEPAWLSIIEQDFIFKIQLFSAYSYNQHWHLGNIGAQCAWDTMTQNSITQVNSSSYPSPSTYPYGYDVAILDAGVDTLHPDLVGRISSESWNCIDNNSNINPTNSFDNHGTAIAGIIAANNLNNSYVLSVSNNYVKVKVLKIGYLVNSTTYYTTNTSQINAFQRARGAAAVCCAFGASNPATIATAAASAIEYTRNTGRSCLGSIIFAATGNSGVNGGNIAMWPSTDPNVLGIGASTTTDAKASFSTYGTQVFAAAPGTSIRTTDRSGTAGYVTSSSADPTANADIYDTELGSYAFFAGTSASTAIAAAIAGTMVAANPGITVDQISDILSDTADKTGGYVYTNGKSNELGYGVLRMCDAVSAAIDLITVPEDLVMSVAITSAPTSANANQTITVICQVNGEGAIWADVDRVKLEFYASPFDEFTTTTNTLLGYSWFYNISANNTLTSTITIPNNQYLANTNYLIVKATPRDYCGNQLGNNPDLYQDSSILTITPVGPQVDLSVEMISTYISQGVRIYKLKYTNTGLVAITSFNRTYGWVGGLSTSNTQTYPGTMPGNSPLQPGQSRTIYLGFNQTPPQYPATYFHQINTVNGIIDANSTNNYVSVTVPN